MLQKYLPVILGALIFLGVGYWWVNWELEADAEKAKVIFREVIKPYPNLKIDKHETETHFSCVVGTLDGINVHLFHYYDGGAKTLKDYVQLEFWSQAHELNNEAWLMLENRAFPMEDNDMETVQPMSNPSLEQAYRLKVRNMPWNDAIVDDPVTSLLLDVADREFGIIELSKGKLVINDLRLPSNQKKHIDFLRRLIELGVALQQQLIANEKGMF